jgi:hypothetical protein
MIFIEGPSVIPLQFSGQHDLDMTQISATDLLTLGIFNLSQNDGSSEGGYAIRHRTVPVSTFGYNPNATRKYTACVEGNYWKRAFPVLFLYGEGGIEKKRLIGI